MSGNLETMIFTSTRSLNEAQQRFAQENEKLRERLGATTLLIGLAKDALVKGEISKVQFYLQLAEQEARGRNEQAPAGSPG